MYKLHKWASLLLVAVFLSFLGAGAAQASAQQSNAVPVLTLEELKAFREENTGKVLIVNYFASWCYACREEITVLKELRAAYPEDQVIIVGVSFDKVTRAEDKGNTPKALAKLIEDMELTFPIYLAGPGLDLQLEISVIPRTCIYNLKGGLVMDHVGLLAQKDFQAVIDKLLRSR